MTRSKWEHAWTDPDPKQFSWYRTRVEPFIVDTTADPDLPRGAALDIGCGNGQVTAFLGERFEVAVGLDFAFGPVVTANGARGNAHVRFGVADARRLPVRTGSASIVVDRGCLHCLHMADIPLYLQEVARVLAVDGRFALVARVAPALPSLRAAIRSPKHGARGVVGRMRARHDRLGAELSSGELLPTSLVIQHVNRVNVRSDVGSHLRHLHLVARRVAD